MKASDASYRPPNANAQAQANHNLGISARSQAELELEYEEWIEQVAKYKAYYRARTANRRWWHWLTPFTIRIQWRE